MKNPLKKTIRSTKAQITHLLEYMADHPDFASGGYRTPNGVIRNEAQWSRLKEALDELGPERSVDQWKICWRDQKSKARAEGKSLKIVKNSTGNVVLMPNFTETSMIMLEDIHNEVVNGCEQNEDSSMHFQDESASMEHVSLPRSPTPPPKNTSTSKHTDDIKIAVKRIKRRISSVPTDDDDDISTYVTFIAAQLRKFRPRLQSKAKLEISKILYSIEMENHNHNNA